ncbi:MAG: chorismate synthase, partial [Nitrospira sp.]|nr:chorismate synthase [Nitrospira sp.]
KTTGTPIALLIRNEDQRSRDYGNLIDTFRPGHADYTYWQKYGIRDHRGGGRSSARETAVRVAAAAIARKWLNEKYGVVIRGYLSQLGPHEVPFKTWDAVAGNPFFAANEDAVAQLESFMDELRKAGDSVGARITTVAEHVPVGWGAPVYAKLDSDLAATMMSINAVKAVEIGAGFASVTQRGSEHGDELTPEGFLSNNAGGILGGISTGQDIVVSIGIKPTSSIRIPRKSIDKQGKPVMVETQGRHDPCVGIRATPIAEAMMALVLMDHALLHRAQNADVTTATPRIPGSSKKTPSSAGKKSTAKINPGPAEA